MRIIQQGDVYVKRNIDVVSAIREELNRKILERPDIRYVEISAYCVSSDIRPEYERKNREYIGDTYCDTLTDSETFSNRIIERKVNDVYEYLSRNPTKSLVGYFVTVNHLFKNWVYVDLVIYQHREIKDFHSL